jgi:hypothetical protein
MSSPSQTEKVVSKQCRNCNGQLPGRDNFCRWLSEGSGPTVAMTDWFDQETTLLQNDQKISESLSSLLINTMKQNMALKTGTLKLNRFGVLAIAAIICIPMWLLIILMSPLYAFMAAKSASTQMSIQ